ncbi:integrase core domain-containing protein, partial [Micrococcus luteus]|uniref:integrase core domain-containing protein n=1 Tax=Micrococcus luteus TaxID=1270 RepID=UPI003879EEE3
SRTLRYACGSGITEPTPCPRSRAKARDWKDEYNHHRRHSSLGYLTPAEYARQCTHQMETDDSQNVRTE